MPTSLVAELTIAPNQSETNATTNTINSSIVSKPTLMTPLQNPFQPLRLPTKTLYYL